MMTEIFKDGFDHYATADTTQKWTSSPGGAIQSAAGRRGSGCFRTTSGGHGLSKTFAAAATLILGFAFKYTGTITAGRLATFADGGSDQCGVYLNADGTLSFRRATTVLGTSASALSAGTWYFIATKVTISDAAGAYEVRVNGTNVVSGSSADTKTTANATANGVYINALVGAGGVAGATCDFDDLYLFNSSGSTNNDFINDARIDTYFPNGNGNSSQLTGSDGNSVDNYLLVDETSQNGDTDYVQSSTASQKDTYAFQDMTHTPSSIYSVTVNMIAKKDDAGTRSICSVTRSGGSDTDGATQGLSAASYADYTETLELDPNTSAAWTKTNFNAAEFGVKVAA